MRPGRKSTRSVQDLQSVADQPAKAIFFSGLVVALVFGLAIRGLLHPEKIKTAVAGAASRIHNDVRVQFADARVELSHGGIPGLAVVVRQVNLDSERVCWMRPRISADEIRLPVSVSSWIRGESPFRVVRLGEVQVRLDIDRPSDCPPLGSGRVSPKPEESVREAPVAGVRLVRPQGDAQAPAPRKVSGGDLEMIEINRLQFFWSGSHYGRLDVEGVRFAVRSASPRVLSLEALLRSVDSPPLQELSLPVRLQAEYKEFPEKILDLRLSGTLREGTYQIRLNSEIDTERVTVSADARHLPLRSLLDFARAFDPQIADLSLRHAWLSGQVEWSGKPSEWRVSPLDFRNVHLEGDLGEIMIPRIGVLALAPLRWEPMTVQVQSLSLDQILLATGRPPPTPVLSKLGQFRGVAEVTSAENFQIVGEHQGLEFVFSNKGRRELQAIHRFQAEIRRESGRWRWSFDRIELDQGVFSGALEATASPDLKDVNFRLRSESFTLSPVVQRLMTRDGSMGRLQANLDFRLRDGALDQIKGDLRIPEVSIEGMSFEELTMKVQTGGGIFTLSPRSARLRIGPDSPAWAVLGSVIPAEWRAEGGETNLTALQAQLRIKSFQQMRWTGFSAKGPLPSSRLQSKGGWGQDGVLDGELLLRSSGGSKSWKLIGTRDEPKLTPAR